jgi:hypothetical protein
MNRKELVDDDLSSMEFQGVVVDTNDPLKQGRAKVRVFGKFDDLSEDDIPWAQNRHPNVFGINGGAGAISIPKKGTVVDVTFNSGNLYEPEFVAITEPCKEMIEEIRNSYEDAHVLLFDGGEKLKMYYTKEKGVLIHLDDSYINIHTDNSITIEHKGTSSIIELRGSTITMTTDSEINMTAGSRIKASAPEVWLDGKETKLGHVPAYSVVRAEPLFAFLKVLSAAVDAKLFPTPGAMQTAVESAEKLATSGTVKVS